MIAIAMFVAAGVGLVYSWYCYMQRVATTADGYDVDHEALWAKRQMTAIVVCITLLGLSVISALLST